ncbi:MAG: pilus assembly PilX N-terminal domain-containing protein [Candidatus Kaiserbacteria bacterium]|nr:pilus assembly PilX N-terminal domain-containing protein [Candidatus Kaiserbacteria bacterium]
MAIKISNLKSQEPNGIRLVLGGWFLVFRVKRGFALLVAVIFMSVMLTLGLALGSLAYKQQMLASSATESQYAFYAADAGLECALYADQGQNQNIFAFPSIQPSSAPKMMCDGANADFPTTFPTGIVSYTMGVQWVVTERLSLDTGKHCADVTVYKPAPNTGTTYIYSQGYDVPCSTVQNPNGARFVSRGLSSHY